MAGDGWGYAPGDVANGHILGQDMQWYPLQQPAGPALGWADPYAQQYAAGAVHEAQADSLARNIANYERLSGILWIVLGIVQLFSLVLFIAGIWNIFAGITRLAGSSAIERRQSDVPARFQGIVGLVLIGLVNLFFGAILGLLFVALDFWVRQRVLDNRAIFNR